jgi:DNA invertase Pin-like site-specific DNA recombinase
MKVFYSRISTEEQNSERQLQDIKGFDYVFTDTCSGGIEFFERPKGKQVKDLIDQRKLTHLEIHSIDRLGRNTLDVLRTWQQLTELGIRVVCRNPNLTNFKPDGTQDEVSEMILSILATMAKFERNQLLSRQKEGIRIAKEKGVYRGRKIGTVETKEKFLSKPDNQKILQFLNKGYKYGEISKIVGCSFSTINKVKMLAFDQEYLPKRKRESKDDHSVIESAPVLLHNLRDYRNLVSSINLLKQEEYDGTIQNVWAYRKANDIRDGVNIKFGNMCNGFPFLMNGINFHNSECAYISGAYSSNDPDSIRIQRLIIEESRGFMAKKIFRHKPDYIKFIRTDFYSFNVQWMFYVVWQKALNNNNFAELLKKVPVNVHLVEDTSHHSGDTADFWGAKNKELKDARRLAESTVDKNVFRFKNQFEAAKSSVANSINDIGHFRGQNVMGKIIKLCNLALIYGQEPSIDYGLLSDKNIYLDGKQIKFPVR